MYKTKLRENIPSFLSCQPRGLGRGHGRGLQKNFFRPFGPQFDLKIGGGGGPPLDPPLISKFQKASHENNKLLSINT